MRYAEIGAASRSQRHSAVAPQPAKTDISHSALASNCTASFSYIKGGGSCLTRTDWTQTRGQFEASDNGPSAASSTCLDFSAVFRLTALDVQLRVRRLSWAAGRVAGDEDFNMLGTKAAALAFTQEDLLAEDWVVV